MKKCDSLIFALVFVLVIFVLPGNFLAFNEENIVRDEETIVAVIDTGVDITHKNLAEHIWTNSGEISGNGMDDDGNGYVDDVSGWNFCDNSNSNHDSLTLTDERHGTLMASIITEKSQNVKIMPLKVFEKGNADTEDIIEAIQYAEKMGAKVVNISWGTETDNAELREVIEKSNMTFVCAVGNDGKNLEEIPVYPACYDFDNVIAVGTEESNYGSTVDVIAEEDSIESTQDDNGYEIIRGTSVAAAIITANVAKGYKYKDQINVYRNKTVSSMRINSRKSDNIAYSKEKYTLFSSFDATKYTNKTVSGDFNGDGKSDVAAFCDCGEQGTRIDVWLSNGTNLQYAGESVWWSNSGYTCSNISGRIVAGDFNGDGKCDIAALCNITSGARLQVWKSTGLSFQYQGDDGWWSGTTSYNTTKITNRVVAGDYNYDGKCDIAAFYDYGLSTVKLHVWKSTGTAFQYSGDSGWWGDTNTPAGLLTGRVVAGKFDSNSRYDIAAFVNVSGQTKIYVWTSTGTAFTFQGTTGWWSSTSYSVSSITNRVVAMDFNNDGKSEIAAFYDCGSGVTKLHEWTSTGTAFQYAGDSGWWNSTSYPADRITGRVVAGDFNSDSKCDIAAVYNYSSDEVRIHEWTSTSTSFQYAGVDGWWKSPIYTSVSDTVSGDFNGDGKNEVAKFYDYGNGASKLCVWKTTGSSLQNQGGWWGTVGDSNGDPNNDGYHLCRLVPETITSFYPSKIIGRMVSGDFNGDGKDDIAALYDCGSSTTQLYIWSSTGNYFTCLNTSTNLLWKSGSGAYTAGNTTGNVVAGDFNGDGKDEIAAFYRYGSDLTKIHVWTANGSSFSIAEWWNSGTGNYSASAITGRVAAGDYNGDGKDEIAAFYDYGNDLTKIHIWIPSGSTFTQNEWWNGGTGNYKTSLITGRVVAGDINGDGKDDLAAFYDYGNSSTKAHAWISSGTAFSNSELWDSGTGNYTASNITGMVVSGLFNGDSKADIVAFYNYGSLVRAHAWISNTSSLQFQGAAGWWDSSIVNIPDVVTNISSTPVSSQISLGWTQVAGAIGYDVRADGVESNTNTNSFIHSGLLPQTGHNYFIRAKNQNWVGNWSSQYSVSTMFSPPTNINFQKTPNSITASWNQVNGATSYDIDINNDSTKEYSTCDLMLLLPNLVPNTKYQLRVRACNSIAQTSDWNQIYEVYTLLVTPSNFSATPTSSSIMLNWNAVSGATSYDVQIDNNPEVYSVQETSYQHNTAIQNKSYQYKVMAKSSSNNNTSNWATPITKMLLLTAPANLRTTAITSTSITLAWDAVSGATRYKIFNGSGSFITETTNVSLVITGLDPDTQYGYKVSAVNGEENNGDLSTAISVKTYPNPPELPKDLTATATSRTITLRWSSVSGATYYVAKLTNNNDQTTTENTVTFNNLAPNTQYTYQVEAVNLGGSSGPKLATKTTLPDVPGTPSITAVTPKQNEITITWEPVAGAINYEVWADVYSFNVGNTTTYTHLGLKPDTIYEYKVRARNNGGRTSWSIPVQVSTLKEKPLTPANLTAEAGLTNILVEWDAVAGAEKYQIEKDNGETEIIQQNSYNHTGLTPKTEHKYKVRAGVSQGNVSVWSEWSEELTKTTLTNDSGIPTNLRARAGKTNIIVEWDEVEGVQGYNLFIDGETSETVYENVYMHEDLKEGTVHTYKVRAIKETEPSDWTEEITVNTENQSVQVPQNIIAESTTNTITLAWDDVLEANKYEIEINEQEIQITSENTFTDSELQSNTIYTYRVRAEKDGIYSPWSEEIQKATQPDNSKIPANITAESTTTSIIIRWDSVENAENYGIQIDGGTIKTVTEEVYSHESLTPNTTHSYRVRSIVGGETSPWSALITKTTTCDNSNVPEELTAQSTEASIAITWNQVADVDGYQIELDGATIETVTGNVYTHSNLNPNTIHTYRVRSVKDEQESEWSCELSASTLSGNAGIPSNIRVESQEKSISISWEPVSGAISYDVEKDSEVANVGNVLIYQHTGLLAGTSHTYRVRAVTENGPNEWSMQIRKATTLKTPSGLQGNPSNTTIRVAWEPVEGAAEYEIEVDGAGIETVTSAVYVNRGLGINTLHMYRVRAKTSSIASEWSQAISVRTNDNRYSVKCVENKEFNLIINAKDIKNFSQHSFMIEYNPLELEVVDLCARTELPDITDGEVIDTDINIEEFTSGYIKFSACKPIAMGKSWSGFVNDIRFKCLISGGTTKIRYEMITN
ncbi:MAG: fibronectin type III domain-containing protein [Ignavibacteriales bacterium]